MKGDAPAPRAMRVDERRDREAQPGVAQRRLDEAALPVGIGRRARASARRSRRNGRNADRWARCDPATASTMSSKARLLALDVGEHGFAGERIGHEDARVAVARDALAAMAEAFDDKLFTYASIETASRAAQMRNSRLPSPPSIGEAMTSVDAPAERLNVRRATCAQTSRVHASRRARRPSCTPRAAGLELRLDQRDELACGAAEREHIRQHQRRAR